MDEILFLISLVREWHCDESWMRNRDIARCNRTARQCWCVWKEFNHTVRRNSLFTALMSISSAIFIVSISFVITILSIFLLSELSNKHLYILNPINSKTILTLRWLCFIHKNARAAKKTKNSNTPAYCVKSKANNGRTYEMKKSDVIVLHSSAFSTIHLFILSILLLCK